MNYFLIFVFIHSDQYLLHDSAIINYLSVNFHSSNRKRSRVSFWLLSNGKSHVWVFRLLSNGKIHMWVFRLLSNEKTHTWIFPLLNHSKFLWFIIAQSYNIVAGTSLVETSKLLITCDKKKITCGLRPLVIFFHHSWLAILMFQLVRFQQQYIYLSQAYNIAAVGTLKNR